MSDELHAALFLNAYLGVPLLALALGIAWAEWIDVLDLPYAERVRRKRIWSRAVLTSPLWVWWALFPLLAVAALVGIVTGARTLWRAAFPGNLPTDGAGPSEGAYR